MKKMEWRLVAEPIKKILEESEWLVLSEFGIQTYEGIKQVDLAAFKWKNNKEIRALGIECKYEETARQSLFSSLGQAIEYQKYFPEVLVGTQEGDVFKDDEKILKKLGIGLLMVNEDGEFIGVESLVENNSFFNADEFLIQIRNRGILLLLFNDLFTESYKKDYFGGMKQGFLWIYNRPKGKVQLRSTTGYGMDSYFGINIEAVNLVRNIVKNFEVGRVLEAFSKLPVEYNVKLYERATIQGKDGYPILDRQKGSVSIKGSIFEKEGYPACKLTKKQIQGEIIERSKKLYYYVHLLVDKKVWDIDSMFTKEEYLNRMKNTKKTLSEVYNLFKDWSSTSRAPSFDEQI